MPVSKGFLSVCAALCYPTAGGWAPEPAAGLGSTQNKLNLHLPGALPPLWCHRNLEGVRQISERKLGRSMTFIPPFQGGIQMVPEGWN